MKVEKDLNFSYNPVPNLRYWHERNWNSKSSPNPGTQSTKYCYATIKLAAVVLRSILEFYRFSING